MGERNLNTPLMKQYVQFKAQYPQAVLLMRVGDFYEAYGDDALTVSKVLGIVLTKRSNGVPNSMELCGFPDRPGHHARERQQKRPVHASAPAEGCSLHHEKALGTESVSTGNLQRTCSQIGVKERKTGYDSFFSDDRPVQYGGPREYCGCGAH